MVSEEVKGAERWGRRGGGGGGGWATEERETGDWIKGMWMRKRERDGVKWSKVKWGREAIGGWKEEELVGCVCVCVCVWAWINTECTQLSFQYSMCVRSCEPSCVCVCLCVCVCMCVCVCVCVWLLPQLHLMGSSTHHRVPLSLCLTHSPVRSLTRSLLEICSASPANRK